MPVLQETREAELFTTLGDDILLFQRMSAKEQLGNLFEYELDLLSKDPGINLQDLLGSTMSVRLSTRGEEQRHFSGYVSRFSQMGMSGKYYVYQASLRPWLWLLSRTANCRIFQQKTVPDIIKQVFRDNGFSDFEDLLSGNYRTWEYCVQYRETDFNFISRLMEQEGIYYYFKNEKDIHTLVMSDSIGSHDPIPGYEEIPYNPFSDHSRAEYEHIFEWFTSQTVQPGSYVMNDYNFKTPKANLEAKLSQQYEHEQSEYEVFDYLGEYIDASEGETYVRVRLEEFTSQHEQAQGQTDARGIAVGGLFSLAEFPRKDQNKEYLVVSTDYEINSSQYESGTATDEDVFSCSFTAMDSQVAFRSQRKTPKPMVQGPQTATVVGKAGEEIWTDEYGRVKVQFHWDREGQSDENSSCWIRVSHPTAGKSWGAVSIPRIGQEVIVDFLEGDPDRPIITGRVYNDVEKTPYGLPASGMISGMKSNSTPGGGGYNEMIMDDTKGTEQIRIHAQYNMDSTILNDQTWTIGNNRTTSVGVDDSETVGSNQTINIGTNQSSTIGANQSISVGSNKTETVAINTAETIGVAKELTIGAAYQITVGAAMNETVGAAKAEEIGGAKSVNVGVNSSENIGSNKSVDAGKNISEKAGDNITGTAGKDVSMTSGKKMAMTAGDDFSIKGDKKGVIDIKDELTIKCGKATIVMKKNGDITINGKAINVKGSGNVVIKGKKILQN